MSVYTVIRTIYRRARATPIIGPLVEALRYRRLPGFSTANRRYAEQQALIEAQGYALAGLRQAVLLAREAAATDRGALETKFYAQVHRINQRLDEQQSHFETEFYAQVHRINLRLDGQQSGLKKEFDTLRQEVLHELRYTHPGEARQQVLSIIDPARVEARRAADGLRLNVGCGHKPDPDRINIDMRELPGVDIVTDVERLPFQAGEVREIYSAHLLEHFPLEQLRRQILPCWCALLARGGELRAVVPDTQAMLGAYAAGEISFSDLHLVMFGGQEYEGDFHHAMFTPESLVELFHDQGLTDVRIEARQRENGLCYECQVVGVKR